MTFGRQQTGQSSTYSWLDPAVRSMGTSVRGQESGVRLVHPGKSNRRQWKKRRTRNCGFDPCFLCYLLFCFPVLQLRHSAKELPRRSRSSHPRVDLRERTNRNRREQRKQSSQSLLCG